ncbi:hypothetical protein KJ969_02845 [Patescibacteria group bacterium]|nr:hypothetical protein [Patescibacteria group bacterium]MBU1922551.1 hypothetical protein [Patescibacteria group bacterium]
MKKNIISLIIVLIIIGIGVGVYFWWQSGQSDSSLDTGATVEQKISMALVQARETGQIIASQGIKTPPYWISFSIESAAQGATLAQENVCVAALGPEWPAVLKIVDGEVKFMGQGVSFDAACGSDDQELRDRMAEHYEILKLDSDMLRIEPNCAFVPGQKHCFLIFNQ